MLRQSRRFVRSARDAALTKAYKSDDCGPCVPYPSTATPTRRAMKKTLKKCLKNRSRLVAARRRIAHLDLGEQVLEPEPRPLPGREPDDRETGVPT